MSTDKRDMRKSEIVSTVNNERENDQTEMNAGYGESTSC